jgi:hypothetical protein
MDIQLRTASGEPVSCPSVIVGAPYVPMIGDEIELAKGAEKPRSGPVGAVTLTVHPASRL